MKNLLKRVLTLTLAIAVILSNPVQAIAATPFQDGLNNGSIYAVGSVYVAHWNSSTKRTTGALFCSNLYCGTLAQGQNITDATNSMIYESVQMAPEWACNVGDHVNSTYSGKTVTGKTAKGKYRLWKVNEGDILQITYIMPDGGRVIKTWFCELVDTNAFYPKYDHNGYKAGYVYYSNGVNIDDYSLDPKNKDEFITMTHCWPRAWGSYSASDNGRVIALFREDHSVMVDVYYKADGTKLLGDLDIYTMKFTAK